MTGPKSKVAWEQGIPWIVPAATEHLERILKPTFTAFELGSGASTGWIAARVKFLISVEHDAEWEAKVSRRLIELGLAHKVELLLVPESSAYVNVIQTYSHTFDFVSIDGEHRMECLRMARAKVKPGGYILLDDLQRKSYHPMTEKLMRGWETKKFQQRGEAAIYRKPL